MDTSRVPLALARQRLLTATRDQVVAAIERYLHPDRLVVTAAGTVEG